jgi:hypothetical protein
MNANQARNTAITAPDRWRAGQKPHKSLALALHTVIGELHMGGECR